MDRENTVDAEGLRQVMRHWASGVAVVTAAYQGQRHGMTVSSFTSVSLEPPLVLVVLARESRTRSLVMAAQAFAVTVLGQEQQALSDRFAGRDPQVDRFADLQPFTLVTGAPLLPGGVAWLDCRVSRHLEAGTHTLFLGQVVAAQATDTFRPLLYYNRAYRQLREQ